MHLISPYFILLIFLLLTLSGKFLYGRWKSNKTLSLLAIEHHVLLKIFLISANLKGTLNESICDVAIMNKGHFYILERQTLLNIYINSFLIKTEDVTNVRIYKNEVDIIGYINSPQGYLPITYTIKIKDEKELSLFIDYLKNNFGDLIS